MELLLALWALHYPLQHGQDRARQTQHHQYHQALVDLQIHSLRLAQILQQLLGCYNHHNKFPRLQVHNIEFNSFTKVVLTLPIFNVVYQIMELAIQYTQLLQH